MPDTLNQELTSTGFEVRPIDHIPPTERHGRVRDQFTFWFAATMNVFNIFLGAIAVEITGNFFWAVVAFSLGTILALWGYDWVHRWQRWMTVVLGITFVIILIQTLTYGGLPAATSESVPA
jgi:purine-cytosine permease-like protein